MSSRHCVLRRASASAPCRCCAKLLSSSACTTIMARPKPDYSSRGACSLSPVSCGRGVVDRYALPEPVNNLVDRPGKSALYR